MDERWNSKPGCNDTIGFCVLIHMRHFKEIPEELKGIVKVGVNIQTDVLYLLSDYGVRVANTLDLRYMAAEAGCVPGGLGTMSENYLNIELDKGYGGWQCSNWDPLTLDNGQIEYAADDGHVGIELFKFFVKKSSEPGIFESWHRYATRIVDKFRSRFLNIDYIETNNRTNHFRHYEY
ncbi:exonuclease 3'-5' domain-containing protein 2-like [Sitodiplosis mosellana]|uniref:exonuclease 3'-5' domain-containing protein 2-like n=1 Tax=Sitodiplosis mosellana TaxID=263140 RepID=UPI0024447E5C|nr:exonuclease 3'-5' domain-containing protein 2-like [Sitodiplosis mosellana]